MSEHARILVVRLSSMGDIVHALPAVASLKRSLPGCELTWVVNPRWAPLLEGNPFVDHVVHFDRRSWHGVLEARRILREGRFEMAVDFQGLIQSALVATVARPDRLFGYAPDQVRERLAALFYSHTVSSRARHIVDRHLDLARAAGAVRVLSVFPLPPGAPEGRLPDGDFVLACPLAGWESKQWPIAYYSALARRLAHEFCLPLVVNGPPDAAERLGQVEGAVLHLSGLPGLIDATRRAAAVIGCDSGPLHLAAALSKPGVAVFGPTDPERNGPYGGALTVLRSPDAVTSYKRLAAVDPSMAAISPDAVFEALRAHLTRAVAHDA